MTETTRRTGGTDALAYQVTVYRRESYLAVKFVLKNVREDTAAVDYRQTVPDDLADEHLSFTSNYMGEAWTFEDATLEFNTDIDSGEQIETVYGIKRVEIPDLVDFIRYATVVVRQNGKTVETVTGIEPDIEGGRDPTAAEETASESGDRPESAAESRPAGGSTPDDGDTDARTDDTSRKTADVAGQSSVTEQQPGVEESSSGVESEETTAAHSASTSVADRDEAIEWETLTPEEEGSDANEASEVTAAADSHIPFSDATNDTGAGTGDERPPALPANRSDYILEDVRGEIESSDEFEWIELADEDEETDSGVLGWVRSRLPL